MMLSTLLAPVRPVRRVFALTAVAATLSLATVPAALAQQPPAPAPAPAPAPKAAPKPAPKAAPKQPAQQPAQQPPAQQQGQAGTPDQQIPTVQSPWTKFCGKEQTQGGPKDVCATSKETRLETGQFLAGVTLIEIQGEPTKFLRVMLPLAMQLPQGSRFGVDKDEPLSAPYFMCVPIGCMAQREVTTDFVARMKKGADLVVQGINPAGQLATFQIQLADFAKANEGPASDPKELEAQQKKMQDELQKRAEEARKKLERQNGGAPAAGAPAATPR